ncbi:MAG: iron-containing alcohol dehydrogenase [Anaerolineales bacterium]|nr:iron-containing alcohol dehydrogenase [Anaerolineales bacterium]
MINKIYNLPNTVLLPFSEVEEKQPTLLITSTPAWVAVKGKLRGLNIVATLEPIQATTEHWGELLSTYTSQAVAVYAVGGGLTADAAKYIATRLDLPLTVCPTALSVDAFLTAASGIRREGCVVYIPTRVPDRLILDLDVIASAPAPIRAAGIVDVLSIATGCWDWKFADEMGQNPAGMEFISWVYDNAQSILRGAIDCAEAAGRGDRDGLKSLYDCLAMEVQLCNQVGPARPEEGSEHYFAYCAEQFTGSGWPHGDLVGPGILLMAERQGQDIHPYEVALKVCNIPLDRIPPDAVRRIITHLPDYCRKHALPFGIAHDQEEIV